MNKKFTQLSEAIINGKQNDAEAITKQLIDEGIKPKEILDYGLMIGMQEVGVRFRDKKYFLPQVLVSARAMKVSMVLLEPLLAKGDVQLKGKIMLGTVKGDVHDIGKNIVSMMLQGAGYKVIDIGIGCSAEQFINSYLKEKPDVIGLSALLTTTMVYMKIVIDLFKENKIDVPIIIGGAPVNKKFAADIGAAGFAKDAYDTVALVDSIIGKLNENNK